MAGERDATLGAWSALLALQALAVRAVEEKLKAAGAPPLAWYDVLLELDRAGGTLSVGALAGRLVIEPYNMTRLLDRLEKDGLIARERSANDRRSVGIVLRERGAALRRKAWPIYQRAILEVLGGLSEKEAEGLSKSLRKALAGLRDRPTG